MNIFTQLAQTTQVNDGGSSMVGTMVGVVFAIIIIVALWRIFQKAGKPGWAAIIPIYNIYVTLKVVGRPGWWVILYFIPIVNLIIQIIVSIDLAKTFGKSTLFGVLGLWLFSFIGYVILGYGDAKYQGAPQR